MAKKTKKATKSKVAKKTTTKKRTKKVLEVPTVLRANSMVDVMAHTIENDEGASEKVKSLPKKDLRYILDLVNATIFGHIANGGKVQFMPWVTYGTTVRTPRKGRNPQTGEEIMIKGSIGFSARAGKGLKELLNHDQEYVKRAVEAKLKEKAEKEKAKKAKKKIAKRKAS